MNGAHVKLRRIFKNGLNNIIINSQYNQTLIVH